MQVEAVELGLTRGTRGNLPEVRLVAEAPDAGAGARTEGDAALDGGAHETGEDGRALGEWVSGRAVVVRLELTTSEEPSDPGADGGEDVRDVGVARWACGVEGDGPRPRGAEDTVQHQRMEVDIQLKAAAGAPDRLRQSALPKPGRATRDGLDRRRFPAGR
jgi:hypothetical protein